MSAIVALNCGSSSIKAAVLAGPGLRRAFEVRAENIGSSAARLIARDGARPLAPSLDLSESVAEVLTAIRGHFSGAAGPRAVVHRVVHGGERFTVPTRIDDEVLAAIDDLGPLAALHNPPALQVIRRAQQAFSGAPHFAVFDTAFHSTLPPSAREYALARELRRSHGIRRVGFHGISHADVMERTAALLRKASHQLRLISIHLGNGASIAAIESGQCVETSMGMTPLEGLVMGTRGGDLDPGILVELMRTQDRTELARILNRESGLQGLTGTNDLRAIEERARDGDEDCRLALSMYAHRVRKYIGAYAAVMGGVDAIAFTGGIGENSPALRQRCVERIGFLGATLDDALNRAALEGDAAQDCALVSRASSKVALVVVRADEERAMAQAIRPMLGGVSS
jgi:acetate kinase